MSEYGSSVYSDLKSFIRKTSSQRKSISRELDSNQIKLRSAIRDHETYCVELSKFYLPELSQDAIEDSVRVVRERAEQAYEDKQERREYLQGAIVSNERRRVEEEGTLESLTLELEEKVLEREESLKRVNSMLEADSEYQGLKLTATKKRGELTRFEERTEEFRADAMEKLQTYDQNLFFTYLRKREFGTSSYSGNRLTKMLDKKLAKRVNFRENNDNYDFLQRMPGLMEEEIGQKRNEVVKLETTVDSIETRAEKEYNFDRITAEGEVIGKKRQGSQGKIRQLDNNQLKANAELKRLNSNQGKYYSDTIDHTTQVFTTERIEIMKERAINTPEIIDDNLVDQIEQVRKTIYELQENESALKEKEGLISKKLNGLKKIERHFTRQDYESSRSRFSYSFDMDKLLTNYMRGQLSERNLTRKMDSAQHFKPRPTPSYRSSSSSSSWGSSSSGGFSSGGFSSGGGGGGGGFSTGGGF